MFFMRPWPELIYDWWFRHKLSRREKEKRRTLTFFFFFCLPHISYAGERKREKAWIGEKLLISLPRLLLHDFSVSLSLSQRMSECLSFSFSLSLDSIIMHLYPSLRQPSSFKEVKNGWSENGPSWLAAQGFYIAIPVTYGRKGIERKISFFIVCTWAERFFFHFSRIIAWLVCPRWFSRQTFTAPDWKILFYWRLISSLSRFQNDFENGSLSLSLFLSLLQKFGQRGPK